MVGSGIIHKTNDLITVINHTFAKLQLNRKHIRDIEDYISKLHTQLTKCMSISTIPSECLQIDQCLWALENVHLFWPRQLLRYHRQRAALESRLLTEDILPPTVTDHQRYRNMKRFSNRNNSVNKFITIKIKYCLPTLYL